MIPSLRRLPVIMNADFPIHLYFIDRDDSDEDDSSDDEETEEETSSQPKQPEPDEEVTLKMLIDTWKSVAPSNRETRFQNIMRWTGMTLPMLNVSTHWAAFSIQFDQFRGDREALARDERTKVRSYTMTQRRARPPKQKTKLLKDDLFVSFMKIVLHHPELIGVLQPNDLLTFHSNMELRTRKERKNYLLDLAHEFARTQSQQPLFRGVPICIGCYTSIHGVPVDNQY